MNEFLEKSVVRLFGNFRTASDERRKVILSAMREFGQKHGIALMNELADAFEASI